MRSNASRLANPLAALNSVPIQADCDENFGLGMADDDRRTEVSVTLVHPSLTHLAITQTTLALDTEATYDWEPEEWTIPINVNVSQMLKLGKLPVQIGGGIRYWADSPAGGTQDWAFRLQFTLLFPK